MFIHRKSELITDFVQIQTESNRSLTLSEDHLIPIVDCSEKMRSALWLNGERFVSVHSRPAKLARAGLCVASMTGERLSLDPIISTKMVEAKGIFAPITRSGNLVVNDILASCYSGHEHSGIQRVIFDLATKMNSWWLSITNDLAESGDVEIPTMLKALLKVTELFDLKSE